MFVYRGCCLAVQDLVMGLYGATTVELLTLLSSLQELTGVTEIFPILAK